ncbi:DNA-binding protein c1d [Entomophthora muscae]|uniref:DNA-binding protein c1d n=1 Tax=Entomophthora muscae TaxID=34485 RepID=A0ACC2U3W8_9FUNG|nr:DNA-binding protein c1d [Entomophthora muscae]
MSEKFNDSLKDVEECLSVLEENLDIISDKTKTKNESSLTILEQCQSEVLLTVALNTLVWCKRLLQTQETPIEDHPVVAEIERTLGYIKKVKIAHVAHNPKTQLNVPAAKRVVKHYIAANTRADDSKKVKHN